MKSLLAFAMNGRSQAALIAVTLAVLGEMLPRLLGGAFGLMLASLLMISSAALVGLVTLRKGPREAAMMIALALFALGALGALLRGQPLALLAVGLGLWLPALLVAYVLRNGRSLGLAVEVAVIGGAAVVVLQHLGPGDPADTWATLMQGLISQMTGGAEVPADQLELIRLAAPWMVGGIAVAWVLQTAAALFLARYWQALLYNPGGFREEFHELRLSRRLLIAVALLMLLGMTSAAAGIAGQLAMVGMVGMFIQGLALAHGLSGRLASSSAWLWGFYAIALFGLPFSFAAISAAGFADGWLDFRGRARSRGDAGGNE